MIRILTIIFTAAAAVLSSFFNNDVYHRYTSLTEVIETYFGSADEGHCAPAEEAEKVVTQEEEQEEQDEKRLLVFETTDLHGYLFDASAGDPERFQYRLAYIANEINKARNSDEYDDVILLDGGDIYQGTPFSSLTGGAPMRLALETIGYDAVALGNHEFDWDVQEYAADREGTLPPYEVGEYFGDPDIPVLACNLYEADTMERVSFTQDYLIIERAGIKTAVIGYIPDYSSTILQEKIEPYYIEEDLSKLNALAGTVIEEEDPDATIILVHGDPVSVAEAMDPELVDLVVGGHTHKSNIGRADNGISFIEGYCYGQGYATAVLVIGAEGNVRIEDIGYTSIVENRFQLYDMEVNTELLDSEIMDISHAAWDAIHEEMGEVLGYVATSVKKRQTGDSPSTIIGNWFTDLELRATEKYGTVAAFYNSGGIRAQFKIQGNNKTRDITVYDIYSMAPFGNSLLIYDITGSELAKLIADGLKDSDYGDQVSGLTFTYTENAPNEPVILNITLDDGTDVDLSDSDTLYRVCVSEYSATYPGSVFQDKEPVIPPADSPIDNESFIEVLREEAAENEGFLYIDMRVRGTKIL